LDVDGEGRYQSSFRVTRGRSEASNRRRQFANRPTVSADDREPWRRADRFPSFSRLSAAIRGKEEASQMLRRRLVARRTVPLLCFVLLITSPAIAHAQGAPSQTGSRRAVWTAVGTGAGFGVGLFLGLSAFDDAVNSDRKVWTTAVAAAAVGGLVGYLVSRERPHPSRQADLRGSALLLPVRLRDGRALSRPYLTLFAPEPPRSKEMAPTAEVAIRPACRRCGGPMPTGCKQRTVYCSRLCGVVARRGRLRRRRPRCGPRAPQHVRHVGA
jgi:hypothetical protein